MNVFKYLSKNSVSLGVYIATGMLISLTGVTLVIRSFAPGTGVARRLKTTSVVVEADVKAHITEYIPEWFCAPSGRCYYDFRPVTVTKPLREAFAKVHVTYPTDVYEQDESEMILTVEKVSDKATQSAPPNRVELQIVSQSLSFAPKNLELLFSDLMPRVLIA